MTRLNVKPGFRGATSPNSAKNYLLLNRLATANEAMIRLTVDKLNQQDDKCTLLRAVLIQNVLSSRIRDKESGLSPSRWMIEESRRITNDLSRVSQRLTYDDSDYGDMDQDEDVDREVSFKESIKCNSSGTTLRFKRSYGLDDDYAEVPDGKNYDCPCGDEVCQCSDEEDADHSSTVSTKTCVAASPPTAIKIHISQKRLKRDSPDSAVAVPVSDVQSH